MTSAAAGSALHGLPDGRREDRNGGARGAGRERCDGERRAAQPRMRDEAVVELDAPPGPLEVHERDAAPPP